MFQDFSFTLLLQRKDMLESRLPIDDKIRKNALWFQNIKKLLIKKVLAQINRNLGFKKNYFSFYIIPPWKYRRELFLNVFLEWWWFDLALRIRERLKSSRYVELPKSCNTGQNREIQ